MTSQMKSRWARGTVTMAVAIGLVGVATPARADFVPSFTYGAIGGGWSITGWNANGTSFKPCPTTMVIPSTYGGSPVIEISDNAFPADPCLSNTGATSSVIIPNSVIRIGEFSFYQDTALKNVTIGNSVTTIKESAFDGSRIQNVVIPASVTTIGVTAFANNPALQKVTFSGDLATLKQGTFSGASGLKTVTFNSNAPYLETGNEVFTGVNTASAIVVYRPGTQVHALSGFTSWGATYGGIRTAIPATVGVGNGKNIIAKKSLTVRPQILTNSSGTVAITVSSVVKGKLINWCSTSSRVAANSLLTTKCKMGKTARNLIKKKKQTFTVSYAFTQDNSGLVTYTTKNVTVKRKK